MRRFHSNEPERYHSIGWMAGGFLCLSLSHSWFKRNYGTRAGNNNIASTISLHIGAKLMVMVRVRGKFSRINSISCKNFRLKCHRFHLISKFSRILLNFFITQSNTHKPPANFRYSNRNSLSYSIPCRTVLARNAQNALKTTISEYRNRRAECTTSIRATRPTTNGVQRERLC